MVSDRKNILDPRGSRILLLSYDKNYESYLFIYSMLLAFSLNLWAG